MPFSIILLLKFSFKLSQIGVFNLGIIGSDTLPSANWTKRSIEQRRKTLLECKPWINSTASSISLLQVAGDMLIFSVLRFWLTTLLWGFLITTRYCLSCLTMVKIYSATPPFPLLIIFTNVCISSLVFRIWISAMRVTF